MKQVQDGRALLATAALAALFSYLLQGCAAHQARLTAEDRAQLGQIALARAYEQPDVVFDTGAPSTGLRLAVGIVGGLNPHSWVVGGPLGTVPYSLAASHPCENLFSEDINDVERRFRETVLALKPDELFQETLKQFTEQSTGRTLVKLDVSSRKISREPSDLARLRDRGIDTILVIERLKIRLSGLSLGLGQPGVCAPRFEVLADWRVMRVRDGADLAAGNTNCVRAPRTTGLSFQELLADSGSIQQSVRTALTALSPCIFCASGMGKSCGYSVPDYEWGDGLRFAAARGDAADIRAIIARGGRYGYVDGRDFYGRTALHVAADGKHHEAMRALVEAGADPNALEEDRGDRTTDYYDIVTIAAVANDLPTLKLALELGCSPKNRTGRNNGTALIAATLLGHADVVRTLIRAGAPLNHVNELGWTALIESIVLGDGGPRYIDTLKALLEAGAKVNLADREGRTPLVLARQRGYTEMVTILERAGAR